jgi:DNA recombination protein RmuC
MDLDALPATVRDFLAGLDPLYLLLALGVALLTGLVVHLRAQHRAAARSLEHNEQLAECRTEIARLEERLLQEGLAAREKIELLQGARQQLGEEFTNLANRIFDDKSQRLVKTSRDTLESTLSPLRTQLKDFRQRVDDVYDKETRDRMSLLAELGQLKELNRQMSEDAVNLTRALKGDSKTQGNWGEVVLERVLEESGLRKGHEYETQVSARTEEGGLRQPDVVVRLPDNKDIVIDAKVSLTAYERYVSADDEADKKLALQAHVQSIRTHIDSLSVKGYEKLEGLRTLDFVLLFIPIEPAFIAAFDSDPGMFRTAYDKQIVVVSPTTLLATLRTVQTIWRYEQQNVNAEKIAREAGALHDQFARVLEALEDTGRYIERASQSWETTRSRLTTGRGNLVRRVQQLEALGARTRKKLPASMVDPDDADIDETENNTDEE